MKRDGELTTIPRGFRRRTLPTAKLAAKAGFKHLLRMAGRKSAPRDPAAALFAAGTLVEDLGALKGLFMKFGQMASYLPGDAPTAADDTLARLQAASSAFAFTGRYVQETYEHLLYKNPNAMRTALPREWLMLNRAQFGLNAVLADLGAEGRWGEMVREKLDAEVVPAHEAPVEPARAPSAAGASRREASA